MIEWKKVDKNNPPDGKFLFFFDGSVFTGWPLCNLEDDPDELDDEGYPVWEVADDPYCKFSDVRYYAEYNRPLEGE